VKVFLAVAVRLDDDGGSEHDLVLLGAGLIITAYLIICSSCWTRPSRKDCSLRAAS